MSDEFPTLQSFNIAIHWIAEQLRERISEYVNKDEHNLASMLSEMVDSLSSLQSRINSSEDLALGERELKEVWGQLKETYETKLKKERSRTIDWGEWELEYHQIRKHGYLEDFLIESIRKPNTTSSISYYSTFPPSIVWKLNVINQKGYIFYTGTATVEEIEALSSVPSLPKEMDCEEAGKRVLDPTIASDEWQRMVNWVRVNSIGNFINSENNIIANAPILYLKDGNTVKVELEKEGQARLTANFKEFLTKYKHRSGETRYVDHSTKGKDMRPIWLIDGQHRIRGLSSSKEGAKLTIPIILISNKHERKNGLPPLSMVAKIFTEINTLQKSLDTLHELYLMHRFSISHPTKKERDFQKWDKAEKSTLNSRANHLSYELAAKLTSNESSPLFTRIKILKQNGSRKTIIDANQWLKYSRNWFKIGPYHLNEPKSKFDIIYKEISNFFNALISTCNHDGWQDNNPRWLTGQKKSLIQETSQFQMILELYESIYGLCWDRYYKSDIMNVKDEIISQEIFERVLQPLKWVDWTKTKRELSIFRGGGERGRRALQVWMEDALSCGESFGLDDVMSEEFRSEAGKGILARPADVKIQQNGVWIFENKNEANGREALSFSSTRPVNAVKVATWTILDENETNITEKLGKTVTNCRNNQATLKLKYDDVIDEVNELKIRVEWRNAGGISKGILIVNRLEVL